jgi:hypothetical protein
MPAAKKKPAAQERQDEVRGRLLRAATCPHLDLRLDRQQ